MVHPNSLANLEKGRQQFEAGDERARICGKKGREALTENIRARKTAKEYAEIIASLQVDDEKSQAKMEQMGIRKKDRTYLLATIMSLYAKGIKKGDVPAIKIILDLLGESAEAQQNVNMTISEGNQVIAYVPDDGREDASS